MENIAGRQPGSANIDPSLSTARGIALSILDKGKFVYKDEFVVKSKYCEKLLKAATQLELLNL